MFWRHVDKKLTAYLHGELNTEAAEKVRLHITDCARCRKALEELQFAARAVQSLPKRSAPDSVWDRIESRIVAGESVTARNPKPISLQWQLAGVGAVLIIALVLARPLLFQPPDSPPKAADGPIRPHPGGEKPGPAWQVAALKGAPRIGNAEVRDKGKLSTGQWLETDSTSAARVEIANIGQADVRPNSRLTLLNSAPNEHRMRLERGELHAKVNAPPRLFLVETRSATAVDLGCEYTLTALPDGTSLLKVQSGWVAMEIEGRASDVPAMMACITKTGRAPGTPYHQKARPALIAALRKIDFAGGGAPELRVVIKYARKRDSLTLWHLLQKVDASDKQMVFTALDKLIPAPKAVTFTKAAAGDTETLDTWKETINEALYPSVGVSFSNLALEVMRMKKKGMKK